MPNLSERRVVIGGLFFFAFWLFVVLPFLYSVPRYESDNNVANKCSAEENKNYGFWEKASCDPTAYFTLWLVGFTGVLAVATVGLGIATYKLWEAGEKQFKLLSGNANAQAKDTRDAIAQATRSAAAMENVAIAMTDNVKHTREIIERQRKYVATQLRAYVFPFDAGLYEGTMIDPPRFDQIDVPGVILNFRNSGHTPARRIISWAQIAVIDIDLEDQLVVPQLEERFSTSLSPGATMPKYFWFERPLSDVEKAGVVAGNKAIFVYGRIEYIDCFDERQFCAFRVRYVGAFPPHKPSGSFLHCQNGNESS